MNVSTFHFENLAPSNEVYDLKHSDYYICHGEGKKALRKIFSKVKYDDFETQHINELKMAVEAEKLVLPSYWEDKHFLLYCYNGKFTLGDSLNNLKLHLEWVNNPKWHTVTDQVLEIWKSGIIYSFGFDKFYRPIIIVNVHMFDLKKHEPDDYLVAVCCLLSIIRRHMFVPGHVENWNVVIDTKNKSLWTLTSYFDLIKRIISTLSINFSSTLEKQFILNPPKILSFSWGAIEKWINPETARKISFASGEDVGRKLLELIDPDQLEEKYGGTVPNLTEFWPPKTQYKSNMISNKVMHKRRSTNFNLTEEEKDIFFSMDNVSESQYELLKMNGDLNSNHQNEKFFEFELKDSHTRHHNVVLESDGVRPPKFCGICVSSSNQNPGSSGCSLI